MFNWLLKKKVETKIEELDLEIVKKTFFELLKTQIDTQKNLIINRSRKFTIKEKVFVPRQPETIIYSEIKVSQINQRTLTINISTIVIISKSITTKIGESKPKEKSTSMSIEYEYTIDTLQDVVEQVFEEIQKIHNKIKKDLFT